MSGTKHATIGMGVVPEHYSVEIAPNMKTFKFDGRVVIKATAEKGTRIIKLNSKELRIKSVKVGEGASTQKASFRMDAKNETMTITLRDPVRGKIAIDLLYQGVHNDKLYGFYRSRYRYGKTDAYMLTTQFEAPNARAALPCIDEPEYKATFDVALVIDKKLSAVSNMPIRSTTDAGKGKKRVAFATTPRMSTYLLYMGVGEMERVEGRIGKLKVGVVTVPGKRNMTGLALDYSKRFLADLQSYFGIKYQLPKMDVLAIPDFAAGAMENWGAVTFRESMLLCEGKKAALATKQSIANVIAHEFAHQWFGDLVTMAWWDDMWLNESFATLMSSLAVDRQFPEWKTMLKYRYDTINTAMGADGMKNTHPISMDVKTVGEIEKLFDEIGYEKGGSMLFMLREYVGEETFRRGLHSYLKKHAYSNATKADLWDAIQKQAGKEGKRMPINRMMKDWLGRPGYPVVNVRVEGDHAELEQERFTISGNMRDRPWIIPVGYTTGDRRGTYLFSQNSARIPVKDGWIKLNSGQSGFYRVWYDEASLARLGEMVKDGRLSALDGWGVENDLFAMVRAGRANVFEYLEFVRKYAMEPGYPMSMSVSEHLNWISTISKGREWSSPAETVDREFHRRALDRLGWKTIDGEDSTDTLVRSMSISALGMLRDPDTVAKASEIFDAFTSRNEEIDSNIKSAVYMTVAFNRPSAKLLDRFMDLYKNDVSPQDKVRALQSVGMLGDRDLVKKALGIAMSKQVRLQDSLRIIVGAGSNPLTGDIYREWAMANWRKLMAVFSPSSHVLSRCAELFGFAKDAASKEKMSLFFDKKQNLRDDMVLGAKKAIERVESNIRFLEING